MKIFRIRNTDKTNHTGKKTNTTKTRFLILASIVLAAISSTVAFSSNSTANSISDLLFGSASLSDTLMNASAQDSSKKDDKTSRLRQLAPNSVIGDLAQARSGHTATRLDATRVLITGGDAGGTAEIFDAATGTSAATGSLSVARSGHTATRLDDGRVLILGGTSSGAATSSTEIYNAATGTFSAGASMNAARSGQTATVLADGRILIAGGDTIGSAEIYDATANTFTSISTMTVSRSGHSAALMNDGRALLVGGSDADGEELYSAEIFNPADSTFSATGNQMAHTRTHALLRVLPDGKVQIIGGNDDMSMEVYDPSVDTIGAHAHLIPTDDDHIAFMQSDFLAAPSRAAFFHNGQTDVLLDRENHSITELDNQALVAGGANTTGNALSSLTVLDSSDATVTTDKLDYQPGQTAVISGTGWQSGELVEMFLHEDPHTTAERRVMTTADANGNFVANYLVEDRDLNVTFIIGAKGQLSGKTAQTTFTDGHTVTSVSPNNGPTTGGTAITITGTGFNPGNATFTVTIGGVAATSVVRLNATTITAVTPANTAGAKNVVVNINGVADTATLTNGFTYNAAQAVSGSWNEATTTITANASGLTAANTYHIDFVPPTGTGGSTTSSISFTGSTTASRTLVQSSLIRVGNWTLNLIREGAGGGTDATQTVSVTVTNTKLSFSTIPASTTINTESGQFQVQRQNGAGIGYIDGVTLPVNVSSTSGTGQFRATSGGGTVTSGSISSNNSQRSFFYIDSTAGTPTLTASATGHTSATTSYTIAKGNQTITFGALATKTFGDAPFAVSATASSGLAVSFASQTTSVCTTGGTNGSIVTIIAAGTCTIRASQAGDSNYNVAPNVDQSFTVNKADQTITFGALATKTFGDAPFVVSATGGGSGNPVTFGATGNCTSGGTNGETITITGAGSCTITASQAGNTNYNAATPVPQTFTIIQKTLTPNITASNKVYDRTTAATILTRTLSGGIVGTDDVTLTGGTATFNTKNVGTGKTVTATGLTLSGTSAGNYVLSSTSATTTADITALAITGSITASNKVYDGTTAATILTRTLTGVIAPDVVSYTGGTATFADKNVGTGKPVSATGLSLSGADAGNYTVNPTANTTADITARPLVVTATGVNKIYDGTASATVTFSDDRISGDVFTVGYTGATFADKNVGNGKTISVSGINLLGTDAGNYALSGTTASATANITPRTLTVSASGVDKVYNGTTTATVTLSSDAILGDSLTLAYTSASFANKNVGTGKAVSVSGISATGTDAGNYTLGSTTANTTANITARALTVTATAASKTYDGNATASVTLSDNRIGGDVFTASFTSATFDNKNVGTNKTVTVNGISISGTDAGNYNANTSTIATADITALAIIGSITVSNKIYDGTTAATILTRTLTGVIAPDVVSYTGGTATFDTKNVGVAKMVTATGLSLASADAGNYTVNTTANTTANITAKALTVSAAGVNKTYDGNITATVTLSDDRVSGDNISTSYTSASFANKNVGTGKAVSVSGISISGTDAGNYTFNTTANTTADITVRTFIVSATAVNRTYDGTTDATVMLSGDNVAGDILTINFVSASFDTKNVGNGKTVTVNGITVTGADMGNYVLASNSTTTTANITTRTLAVTATASNKTYDGNANASVVLSDNRISGDTFSVSFTSATFDNKNAGTGKTVTISSISISGGDSGNYSANTSTTATADITALAITGSITASNKVYDGNASASILTRILAGQISGDDVSLTGGTATFDNKNVGIGKLVTAVGFSLSGADAGNYTVNSMATTNADITPRALIVSATGINKTYDGNTSATVTLSDDKVSGDDVMTSYTSATFADKNVGTGKSVSVSGISISGADAGNYTSNTTAMTTADITQRTLTVSATGANKVYDGNASAIVTLADDRVAGDVLTASYTSATFNDKTVGAGKPISVTGISISGTDAGNYMLASTSASASAGITALAITGSITASNKTYDGTTTTTILTRTLVGVIAPDVVSYTGGTATFDNKNAGVGKTVSATGLGLSGVDAGNYTVNSTADTTADITALGITGSITVSDKIYDGNNGAAILTRTLTGVIAPDVVAYDGGTATFADKNVGMGKTVTATGLGLTGADAANYSVNSTALTTANITAKSLTVSAAGVNKTYDGNTSATVTLSTDKLSGDDVMTSYLSASFADKNVGTGKAVSVSGISISGADATNYALSNTAAATTADITVRTLTVSATAVNRTYDGTTDATVMLSGDNVAGDILTINFVSASFDTKNVGNGKTVTVNGITVTGADMGNYVLASNSTTTTANITTRTLAVTATAASKTYDGNTTASVMLSDNRVAGDVLSIAYTTATFDTKDVGTGKTVTVNSISVSGTDSGNYSANTSATAMGDITALAITGSITAASKTYDGLTTAMILTRTLSGVIGMDVVSYTGGTATFADKNVANGKTVTATGLGLSGAAAGNYTVNSTAVTTANITARTLTVSASGVNKVYDGNSNATVSLSDDKVSGDDLTTSYASASFNNKNVGTNKPVSVSGISIFGGADAGNYVLGNTTANTTANITQKTLTVSASGVNKTYDGNASATVNLSDDRVAGDVLTASYTSAMFANKNVGTGKTVSVSGISISGTDAGNYLLGNTTAMTTSDISALGITGSITAASKIYDGNASAMITSRTLSGQVSGDAVSYTGGAATFDNKNVGIGKTVTATGLTLSGADAGNYTVNSTAMTTADITALAIVGSITANSKTYDGLTAATIATRTLTGVIGSDDVSYVGGTANFSDKNVANGKIVTATGLGLSGADAGNYSVNSTAGTTADITARALTVSASGVNKVYDGGTNATVNLSDNRVSGDTLSTSYTSASFADKNVGTGKPVSVSGISISGADVGNYTFNTAAMTTADITQKVLTVSAGGVNKVYDGNTNATVTLSDNRVSGDVLTASYTSASFNNKTVGTGKPVSVSGISISGTDAGNYTFNTTAATTADITALAITGSITASNKVYDGTTTAAILTRTLTGVISGDVVSYTGGTANFANKNVGTGKTVNATGLSLSGADAGNYTVNTTASTTANITARALTVSATAANKVFDGTTTAMATLFDNRVAGDVLTVSYTSANFDTPNIGTGKTVTVNGISISGTDAGNYTFNTTATTTASITAAVTTTSVTVIPNSQQYSDKVSFTATIAPGFAGVVPAASTVTFFVGTQNMGTATLAAVTGGTLTATIADVALLEGVVGQMSPGIKTVTAVFSGVNPNFTVNNATTPLTITREDARIFYTGVSFVNTTCATCSTATAQLSATVKDITAITGDPDVCGGNISNATLTFVNRDTNTDIATVPISLVSTSDTKVGTAVYNWNVNIGSADSLDYTIGFRVNGYYTRNDSTDNEVVTISKPIGTNFITGGGYLVMTNPTSSAGQYAGAAGLKTNFGFNVKYNNSGRSLQGRVNVIVRGSGGRVYQIKGNQMDTLTVNNSNPAARTALYTGKCNLTDITDPLLPISLGGGHSFQMKLTDKGEPGNTDTVGITVYANNTGALLYSSRWNGTTTIEQMLGNGSGGGNLVVR